MCVCECIYLCVLCMGGLLMLYSNCSPLKEPLMRLIKNSSLIEGLPVASDAQQIKHFQLVNSLTLSTLKGKYEIEYEFE